MSVTTTADEHLDSAKENIQSAIKNLSEIVVEQCWGSEEYNQGFRDTLRKTHFELLELRDRIS